MKKSIILLSAAALSLAAVSCSSPEKLAEAYNDVQVTCVPEVLEVVAGKIDAVVTAEFPAKYFDAKGILEVTPVLVYEGGEQTMAPFVYQGEKVKENYKVVTKDGGKISESVHFTYAKGVEKATLIFRVKARQGSKEAQGPDKKVAVGCNTTYMLGTCTAHGVKAKADGYQDVIKSTVEGQVNYAVSSSVVRNGQYTSASIKNYQEALKEALANERKTVTGTQIVSYASPEGKVTFNEKLSANRGTSGEKAYGKVTKKIKPGVDVDVQSIGEDWEGFQELVKASDIEDKDLILRVLSMYSDSEVREAEIKNLSAIYSSLKKEVLPALRRSRFITSVEFQNYSTEELKALVESNIDVLDEAALLHTANILEAADAAEAQVLAVYDKAIEKFASETAKYNKAVYLYNNEKVAEAEAILATLPEDVFVKNFKGVLALQKADYATAHKYLDAAYAECKCVAENVIALNLCEGRYADALKVVNTPDVKVSPVRAAVVLLVNAKPQQALDVLADVKCCGGCCQGQMVAYVKAIALARLGKTAEAAEALKTVEGNECLSARAKNDVEFLAL